MDIQVVTQGEQTVIEGPPGAALLRSTADTVTLLESCFEHGTRKVMLYAENLTAQFFDISSGEAGEILQKLRNYRVKLALVVAEGVRQSSMFPQLMADESRGNEFRIFADRDAALDWLLG